MMPRALLTFVGYQTVWVVSALGAAGGWALAGPVAAALLIGVHLAIGPDRLRLAKLVALCGVLGLAAESLLASSGLITYAAAGPFPPLAPLWIVSLWLAFATTIAEFERLLGANRLLKAAALGALLGPLAYLGGERLGALAFMPPRGVGVAAVSALWALSLPMLMVARARLTHASH